MRRPVERPLDRVPESPEAEAAVLGAILYDGRTLDELATQLSAADFYGAGNQAIYTAAAMLHTEGRPVTLITVTDRLRERNQLDAAGGTAYLSRLLDGVFGGGLAGHYAEIVRARSLQRQCLRLVMETAMTLQPPSEAWRSEVERLQLGLFTITQSDRRQTMASIAELAPAEYDRAQELWRCRQTGAPASDGLPTGFRKIDELIGGLHPGDLVVIGGRPAQGKTTLLNNMELRLALAQIGVLMFSVEMPAASITQKWLASLSGVPVQRIRRGDFRLEDPLKLAEACDQLRLLPILVDDEPALQVADLRARVRQAVNTHHVQAVFVDYLQRLHVPTSSGKNRQEEVAEIAQGLKTVAREAGVPVVAAAQLSRRPDLRGEDARPQLSDLRESGRIEAEADIVAFLHRDAAASDRVRLIVAKHRMGSEGEVVLRWNRELAKFEEA